MCDPTKIILEKSVQKRVEKNWKGGQERWGKLMYRKSDILIYLHTTYYRGESGGLDPLPKYSNLLHCIHIVKFKKIGLGHPSGK